MEISEPFAAASVTRYSTRTELPPSASVSDTARIFGQINSSLRSSPKSPILTSLGKTTTGKHDPVTEVTFKSNFPAPMKDRYFIPLALCAVDKHILMCDSYNNKVHICAKNGCKFKSISVKSPTGVTANQQGELYVSVYEGTINKLSYRNNRFIRTAWVTGLGNGIRGLKIDAQGNVYVVQSVRHCILKFDPTGKLVMFYGSGGSGTSQLNKPNSFCLNESVGELYVCDTGNNRIQVYDLASGQHIKSIGNGTLIQPTAIKADSSGDLFVGESGGDPNVKLFDPTGNLKYSLKDLHGIYYRFITDIEVDECRLYVSDYLLDKVCIYNLKRS